METPSPRCFSQMPWTGGPAGARCAQTPGQRFCSWEAGGQVTGFDGLMEIYVFLMVYHVFTNLLLYGGFHKWGYTQIIHYSLNFYYKPSILGIPHSWNPPYVCLKFTYILLYLFSLCIGEHWWSISFSRERFGAPYSWQKGYIRRATTWVSQPYESCSSFRICECV